MPEDFEAQEPETKEPESPRSRRGAGTAFLIIALLGIAAIGSAFGYQQHQRVAQLTEQEQQMNTDMSAMRQQMDEMAAKLTALATPPPESAAQPGTTRRAGVSSRQLKQLQAKVSEQEKQLQETRDAVDKTRTDLEGGLASTRDELGGSIARTHDELELLKKQGQNDYFEFNLAKSKSFQRVGPLSLSLRKADVKHKNFDIRFLVDDNQLEKKKVNLYEPVWIHRNDDPHPMQLVVYRVEKNRVQGYVTAPKFKQSELVASTPAPPEN